MGGGGSAPSISGAIGEAQSAFPGTARQYRQFANQEPLLKEVSQFGLKAGQAINPYILDILSHPYSVPRELLNMATQGARAGFQARGNAYGNQALAGELMNRENIRQQRIAQAMGLAGQSEQLLIQPEMARVGAFSSLMNPLYGAIAPVLGAQTASDASNKSGVQGTIGTVGSVVGSVAAAY